ncbi:MAG: SsrA-binding protein [Planctomycetes bacterium]|jgi:SsrA-binding protein|nr:SsrA-binding protein [Planctomycetota bacterium]
MARDSQAVRVIAKNRRARHDYEILDTLECGMALVGTEVKSLRAGRASIGEAYGRMRRGELWLVGATIPEYSHGNMFNHETTRDRKLLAHGRELRSLEKRVHEKGVTLVPLTLYFRGHRVKLELALVRGKRQRDRRQDQKQRDAKREIDRAMSRRR